MATMERVATTETMARLQAFRNQAVTVESTGFGGPKTVSGTLWEVRPFDFLRVDREAVHFLTKARAITLIGADTTALPVNLRRDLTTEEERAREAVLYRNPVGDNYRCETEEALAEFRARCFGQDVAERLYGEDAAIRAIFANSL